MKLDYTAMSHSDLHNEFSCLIGMEIMTDLVICASGHSYERVNIATWLANKDTSPLTGEVLPNKELITNHVLGFYGRFVLYVFARVSEYRISAFSQYICFSGY
jgi:hypothetical protein